MVILYVHQRPARDLIRGILVVSLAPVVALVFFQKPTTACLHFSKISLLSA